MLERFNPYRKQEEPEQIPPPRTKSPESIPQDASLLVEHDVIARSSLPPEQWIERYGAKFRELWEANKDQFLELKQEKPEELYGLISQLLETEGH